MKIAPDECESLPRRLFLNATCRTGTAIAVTRLWPSSSLVGQELLSKDRLTVRGAPVTIRLKCLGWTEYNDMYHGVGSATNHAIAYVVIGG